jgi:hypothetical protein
MKNIAILYYNNARSFHLCLAVQAEGKNSGPGNFKTSESFAAVRC